MKRTGPSPAFHRLREIFRPPRSFGAPEPWPSSGTDEGLPNLNAVDRGTPPPLSPDDPPEEREHRSDGSTGHPPGRRDRLDAEMSEGRERGRPGTGRWRLPGGFQLDAGMSEGRERGRPGAGRWRARIDPGMLGFRVLALAGLLGALLAGAYLWWSRPEPRPAPEPVVHPARITTVAATGPTPSPAGATLVVDVAGKVRHPGVVTLPPGSRVIDAIKAAGGLRPGAKTGTLNLARKVLDGEQILVGVDATPAPQTPTAPAGSPVPGAPLDLNTATAAQLDQLPGVGPVLAQRIVDYRTQHAGFRSIDDLRQVSGIGEAKFADLKPLVRV